MEAILNGPSGPLMLGSGSIIIGRTADNHYVVNDQKASSHHLELRSTGQGHTVMDFGSTNGTFVNEQPLPKNVPRVLREGDRIRIGDTVLTYEAAPAMAAPEELHQDERPYSSYGEQNVPGQIGQAAAMVSPTSYGGYSVANGQSYDAQNRDAQPYAPPPPPPVALPYSPPPPAYPGARPLPVKPARRRGPLWIGLVLVFVLLVLGNSALFWYLSRPTPAKALDTFCTALKGNDYATAYGQLSSHMQHQVAQPIFKALLTRVQACSYSDPTQSGSNATSTLVLNSAGKNSSSPVTLVQDSNSAWKIDVDQPLTVLPTSLDTYCTALKGGDMPGAYSQLSAGYQARLSLNLFKNLTGSVQSCAYTVTSVAGSTAQAQLVLVYKAGSAPETNTSSLVQAGAAWKIEALSLLSTPTNGISGFCNALKSKDYTTAYELLTKSFQTQFGSVNSFKTTIDGVVTGNRGITSCEVSNVNQQATTASGTNVIHYGNGKVETDTDYMQLENTIWKINIVK